MLKPMSSNKLLISSTLRHYGNCIHLMTQKHFNQNSFHKGHRGTFSIPLNENVQCAFITQPRER